MDCRAGDGILFLARVANEGTVAASDDPRLLFIGVTGLFDNVCLCCKKFTNTSNIIMIQMNGKVQLHN